MSPLDQLELSVSRSASRPRSRPPLQAGDRLSRAEFEARSEAMPESVKAELIDGVVYLASPAKNAHGVLTQLVSEWFGSYLRQTEGCEASANATLRLDELDEPQPDNLLRLVPEAGGRSRVDEDGYLVGPVELVVEVAASSAAYDLHQKKLAYFRHGVLEYAVVVVHSEEVVWFVRGETDFVPLAADARGVFRSRAFPGLWLDALALLDRDARRLQRTLDRGVASKEHARFAAELKKKVAAGRRKLRRK